MAPAPPGEPKPLPQPYETGSYAGKVLSTWPISFTVVRDAAGRGFLRDLQLTVKLLCDSEPFFETVTERVAAPVAIVGTGSSVTTAAESGDSLSIKGSLKGHSANGWLRVSKQRGPATCQKGTSEQDMVGWAAEKRA